MMYGANGIEMSWRGDLATVRVGEHRDGGFVVTGPTITLRVHTFLPIEEAAPRIASVMGEHIRMHMLRDESFDAASIMREVNRVSVRMSASVVA